MWDRAKDWFALKKRAAIEFVVSTGGSTLLAFFVSLLGCYWIVVYAGFLPAQIRTGLFHPMHHLAFHLLFLIPTSLAIALKKGIAFLLVLPYLALLGFGLVQILLIVIAGNGVENWLTLAWVLFAMTVAVPIAIVIDLWDLDGAQKRKSYQVALLLQLALSAGLAYYYTFHYGVWHLSAEQVSVRRLRFDGALSLPLIEEDAAFVVDRHGRLYRIDLTRGRKRVLAQIPWPTAAEVGFPELVLPTIEHPTSPFRGLLARVDEDELSFRYIYRLWSRDEHFHHDAGTWTIEVTINQESGQTSWRLKGREREAPIQFPLSSWRTAVGGRPIWVAVDLDQYRPFRLVIAGEGIKVAIDPLNPWGTFAWYHANHGWILVATDHGGLIIATIKER